jgi:uncharacterized membrane protein (DUF373 family)
LKLINKKNNFIFTIFELIFVLLLLLTILMTAKEIIIEIYRNYAEHTLLLNYKRMISEILLLTIGVELALLILKKDIFFVIDILILATARKLITYENSLDMFICVICVVLLLMVKVFKTRWLKPEEKTS